MISAATAGAPPASALAVRPRDPRAGRARLVRQARPALAGPQSGHVHLRGRRARGPRCSSSATLSSRAATNAGFDFAISIWLWFTVLFANFAEAVAEGRGKAQADFLRRTKTDTQARRVVDGREETRQRDRAAQGRRRPRRRGRADRRRRRRRRRRRHRSTSRRSPANRRRSSAKPAATAARSPAARACCRITSSSASARIPGESFLDRMIALVEGAQRQKTPNEIALSILLAGLTIIFLIAVATLAPFSIYAGNGAERDGADRAARLPDPDDDRRPALGDRHRGHGSRPAAQRARDERPRGRSRRRRRHAAARQDRHDHARQPPGDRDRPSAPASRRPTSTRAAYLSSLPDETPEGRSIVALARATIRGLARRAPPAPARRSCRSARTRA